MALGFRLGKAEGHMLGNPLGKALGNKVGYCEGERVGAGDGSTVGIGTEVGVRVGKLDGVVEVGEVLGASVVGVLPPLTTRRKMHAKIIREKFTMYNSVIFSPMIQIFNSST